MRTLKVGNKVRLTRETADKFFEYPEDVEFMIVEILEDDLPYQIVVNNEKFGKDWFEFFDDSELVLCE